MNNVVMVTGHRPQRLGSNYRFLDLVAASEDWLKMVNPRYLIQGGALGFDLAMAVAAYNLGIPYTMALPFKSQASRWSSHDYARWVAAKDNATNVVCISKDSLPTDSPGSKRYAAIKKLHKRNRWMVDELNTFSSAIVLALWDGEPTGGTYKCIEYCKTLGLPIINLWDTYLKRQ